MKFQTIRVSKRFRSFYELFGWFPWTKHPKNKRREIIEYLEANRESDSKSQNDLEKQKVVKGSKQHTRCNQGG